MKEEGLGLMVKSLFRILLRAGRRFSFDRKVWCGWGRGGWVGGWVGVGMGSGLRVGGPCNSVRRVPITL